MNEQRNSLLEYERLYNSFFDLCKDAESTHSCVIKAVIEIKGNCDFSDYQYWNMVMMHHYSNGKFNHKLIEGKEKQ
jgi:hypothetical protein